MIKPIRTRTYSVRVDIETLNKFRKFAKDRGMGISDFFNGCMVGALKGKLEVENYVREKKK